jgi:hypothetical protein
MSPQIKPHDEVAKGGKVVPLSPSTPNSSDPNGLTEQQFLAQLGQLLTSLAHDLSLLNKYSSEALSDEVEAAQATAKHTDAATKKFLADFDQLQAEIAEAQRQAQSSSLFNRGEAEQNAQLVQQLLAQLQSLVSKHEAASESTNDTSEETQKLIQKLFEGFVKLCTDLQKVISLVATYVKALADAQPSSKPNANASSTPAAGTPASGTTSSTDSDNDCGVSTKQFLDEIFQILTELAHDLGLLIKMSAESQQDQVDIAKKISANVHTKTVEFIKKYDEEVEAEREANSGFLGFLHKVFGNGIMSTILTALIGALFCETGFGALMLVAAVTLQATGVMDKMTAGLSSVLQDMGIPASAADIVSGIIITAVFTGGAGAEEAVTAKVAAKTTANVAEKETATIATKEIEMTTIKTTEKSAAEDAEEQGANAASKQSDSSASKSADGAGDEAKKPAKFRLGTATVGSLTASLFGTNLTYNILVAAGMDKDKAKMWATIINIIIGAIASLGAIYANGGAAMAEMKSMSSGMQLLRTTTAGVGFVTTAGQAYYNIDSGLIQIKEGNIQGDIAPITESLTKLEGALKINDTSFDQAQKFYQALTNTREQIFDTDFAIAWETVVQG